MPEARTEISSLGEFGLIDHLTKNIELQNASSIVGVGDDGAVLDHFGKQIVVTTDLLIEGVHFDLMYTPMKHLGYIERGSNYERRVCNECNTYANNTQYCF
jgi:thiamine-monophosphate kinase